MSGTSKKNKKQQQQQQKKKGELTSLVLDTAEKKAASDASGEDFPEVVAPAEAVPDDQTPASAEDVQRFRYNYYGFHWKTKAMSLRVAQQPTSGLWNVYATVEPLPKAEAVQELDEIKAGIYQPPPHCKSNERVVVRNMRSFESARKCFEKAETASMLGPIFQAAVVEGEAPVCVSTLADLRRMTFVVENMWLQFEQELMRERSDYLYPTQMARSVVQERAMQMMLASLRDEPLMSFGDVECTRRDIRMFHMARIDATFVISVFVKDVTYPLSCATFTASEAHCCNDATGATNSRRSFTPRNATNAERGKCTRIIIVSPQVIEANSSRFSSNTIRTAASSRTHSARNVAPIETASSYVTKIISLSGFCSPPGVRLLLFGIGGMTHTPLSSSSPSPTMFMIDPALLKVDYDARRYKRDHALDAPSSPCKESIRTGLEPTAFAAKSL